MQRDRDRANGSAYQFGLFVDQHVAGEVNLNNVVRGAMQSGTIGYWIDQARAGHAYVAEAVVVVVQFAFEQLGLHRVEICIVPRNLRSRRVMEKLGIREEGTRAALPGDQRRVGGPHPLRHDRSRNGTTGATNSSPRGSMPALEAVSGPTGSISRCDQYEARPAFSRATCICWARSRRSCVRRFHILVFQCRLVRPRLASLLFAISAS